MIQMLLSGRLIVCIIHLHVDICIIHFNLYFGYQSVTIFLTNSNVYNSVHFIAAMLSR